ncbi:MAG: ATP-dependent DNA helicase RecQ [Rikenellaceae bacterium]
MKRAQNNLPSIDEALRTYWGYESFRPMQREIIESIIAGQDTLALLPTGGGKSLTYQVPALAMPGTCIVVTPLIALMKDQVDRLRRQGVPAVAIHSGLSRRAIDIALDNAIYGSVKLIYMAPERLSSHLFRTRLQKMNVSIIAVDEAHCISQWGYDFRPSYLKIGELREFLPGVPILALTASATKEVCEDIMHHLKFKENRLFRGDFSRKNLSYAVRHTSDKNDLLLRILSNVNGSAIVYARTRKGCEQISEFLINEGYTATFYHGGLPNAERSLRQDEWLSDETRIMVATNAFGMGIDKPDVRVVIHYALCNSLEAYYQEAGRAGRDGERSYAVLMVSPDDPGRITRSLDDEFPSLELIKDIYDKICASFKIAYGEGGDISFVFDLRQFCRDYKLYSPTVINAMKILQMNNYLSYVDEMDRPAHIMFIVSRDELYKVRVDNQDLDPFIRVLLRLYDGVFSEFRAIDEIYISVVSGYTIEQIKEKLKRLWLLRLIRYIPTNYTAMVYLETPRLPIEDIYISPESYKYRKDLYKERLDNMVSYSINETKCRSQYLEEYFGVDDSKECGACDICILKRRGMKNAATLENNAKTLQKQIIEAITNDPCNIKVLTTRIQADSELIVNEVDKMLQSELIHLDSNDRLSME